MLVRRRKQRSRRLSGVPVDRYHILTFIIGGLMAALSGIIYASRLNSATPLAGQGYELDAIASTVIGVRVSLAAREYYRHPGRRVVAECGQ